MKKSIPFLIFVPLLIASIYIYYVQFQNNKVKRGVASSMVQSEKIITPIPTSSSLLNNTSQEKVDTIQSDQINLIISSPESGITMDTSTITLSGTTQPNAFVVINDAEIVANKDGSFSSNILLDEGDNYISIVAYNESGNVAEREILVTRTIAGL